MKPATVLGQYPVLVTLEDDGDGPYYFARVLDLPGCMTHAESLAELGPQVDEAIATWIEMAQEDGEPVPEPSGVQSQGHFVVRGPRWLHRALAQRAAAEGVSLNALVVSLLSKEMGRAAEREAKRRKRGTG